MQLVKREWNEWPTMSLFEQLFGLRNELNRMVESPLGEFTRGADLFNGWAPAVDMFEDKDNVTVTVELPGMRKEDINISLHEGALSITGERKREQNNCKGESYRCERFYGRFHRVITLPRSVAGERVKASFKDGILTVTLPKTEEAKPKQIEVTVS